MKQDYNKKVDLVALLKLDFELTEYEEEGLFNAEETGARKNIYKIMKIILY